MQLKSIRDREILNVEYKKLIAYKSLYGLPLPDDNEHDRLARMIACVIHDLNWIWTGFISKAARDAVLAGDVQVGNLCPEHFKSRQKCGAQIIKLFEEESPTYNRFVDVVSPLCLTHRTLREENHRLDRFQRNSDSWVEAYRKAGVELIDVGYCKSLRKERIEKYAKQKPTKLEVVDQMIHDPLRYTT